MEDIGAEVSLKIRSAIKAKLMEIGVYVDEELPDYVMVMVANKRSKEQMDDELELFLGAQTSQFTTWLHQVLQKLQEVTVGNLGGIKRKVSEESKKKKKLKLDSEKKAPKKKIKVEPEDDNEPKTKEDDNEPKTKEDDKLKKDDSVVEDINRVSPIQQNETSETNRKARDDLKETEKRLKEKKDSSKSNKRHEEPLSNAQHCQNINEKRTDRSKSHSSSSQAGDTETLDDEDCINIRTDGELLDTAEEINNDETAKKSKRKELVEGKKKSVSLSPLRTKGKDKQSFNKDVNSNKKQISPRQSPQPKTIDKVVDARELLNRKKTAKQLEAGGRARTRSKDRSLSPPRKRRNDDRENNYRDDRNRDRQTTRDEDRGRVSGRDREVYSSKRRDDRTSDRTSRRKDNDRINGRDYRRRDSSNEPVSKRTTLNKSSKSSDKRKLEMDSFDNQESEELRKRVGVMSRVVPRPQEPEEDVDAPVPSVVKVTPRPRRPPNQQPCSTLIMKAISEANKSLANVPARPDSTQRARKEPVRPRTLRQLERIPPEKIAVSITNPLALQTVGTTNTKASKETSLKRNNEESNKSPSNNLGEVSSSEPDAQKEINDNDKCESEVAEEETRMLTELQEPQEPELEIEPTAQSDAYIEQADELSDTQFVVTLNGYDPDGLYSQSEMEEGDNDDWLKDQTDEEPVLTSTPEGARSPRLKRERTTSPIIIMNTPAVNHANLIEVELVKSKSTERCKYWPACKLDEKCIYYHPTKPCKVFPNCKFGDACLYIHPQCKFNALCNRKDCVFAHSPAHTPLQPAAASKPKALYGASAVLQCKFYPHCTNINCQFAHPSRACRFGMYCTKKDCSFDHGQVAPVDKLKWTRVPTT